MISGSSSNGCMPSGVQSEGSSVGEDDGIGVSVSGGASVGTGVWLEVDVTVILVIFSPAPAGVMEAVCS